MCLLKPQHSSLWPFKWEVCLRYLKSQDKSLQQARKGVINTPQLQEDLWAVPALLSSPCLIKERIPVRGQLGPLQGHSSDSDSEENLIPSSKMKQWKADFRRKAARNNNSRENTIRKDRRLCMLVELFPPLQGS